MISQKTTTKDIIEECINRGIIDIHNSVRLLRCSKKDIRYKYFNQVWFLKDDIIKELTTPADKGGGILPNTKDIRSRNKGDYLKGWLGAIETVIEYLEDDGSLAPTSEDCRGCKLYRLGKRDESKDCKYFEKKEKVRL
jgi:hypothetical protein